MPSRDNTIYTNTCIYGNFRNTLAFCKSQGCYNFELFQHKTRIYYIFNNALQMFIKTIYIT